MLTVPAVLGSPLFSSGIEPTPVPPYSIPPRDHDQLPAADPQPSFLAGSPPNCATMVAGNGQKLEAEAFEEGAQLPRGKDLLVTERHVWIKARQKKGQPPLADSVAPFAEPVPESVAGGRFDKQESTRYQYPMNPLQSGDRRIDMFQHIPQGDQIEAGNAGALPIRVFDHPALDFKSKSFAGEIPAQPAGFDPSGLGPGCREKLQELANSATNVEAPGCRQNPVAADQLQPAGEEPGVAVESRFEKGAPCGAKWLSLFLWIRQDGIEAVEKMEITAPAGVDDAVPQIIGRGRCGRPTQLAFGMARHAIVFQVTATISQGVACWKRDLDLPTPRCQGFQHARSS